MTHDTRCTPPGVGEAVPGHVVEAGLGAVCEQELVEGPGAGGDHAAVPRVVEVVHAVGEGLHHHPVLPEAVHPVPGLVGEESLRSAR